MYLISFDLKKWLVFEIMLIYNMKWFEKESDCELKVIIKISLFLKVFNICCWLGYIGIVLLVRNEGILSLCWFYFFVS